MTRRDRRRVQHRRVSTDHRCERRAAALAECRVVIVRRSARVQTARSTSSAPDAPVDGSAGSTRARLGASLRAPCLSLALQLALDQLAVAGAAGIDLLHQHMARARSRPAISSKSFGDTFPIARSNSSSLIERSTSAFSRSSAARARSDGRSPSSDTSSTRERRQHAIERGRGERRRRHRETDENQMLGRRLPRQQHRDGRGRERGEHEEVPGPEAGVGRSGGSRSLQRRFEPHLVSRGRGAHRPASAERGIVGGAGVACGCRGVVARDQRNATTATLAAPVAPIRYGKNHARRLKPFVDRRGQRAPGRRTPAMKQRTICVAVLPSRDNCRELRRIWLGVPVAVRHAAVVQRPHGIRTCR